MIWTPCVTHQIDLIFEDIENKENVAKVIKTARNLINYIYNHDWLLAKMQDLCEGDLVSLDNLMKKKSNTKTFIY